MKRSMVHSSEAEQAQFLAGRRVDGQAVGVVGIALRGSVPPALLRSRHTPLSRSSQWVASQAPASSDGSPPGVPGEDDGGSQAADQFHQIRWQ